mmetsp:Transcript_11705/g.29297  ORF Transcript_11705/g.29297 Transcript_11705/m.29297 type:complete len:350 (+) Transcript_11705:121-1170(+)
MLIISGSTSVGHAGSWIRVGHEEEAAISSLLGGDARPSGATEHLFVRSATRGRWAPGSRNPRLRKYFCGEADDVGEDGVKGIDLAASSAMFCAEVTALAMSSMPLSRSSVACRILSLWSRTREREALGSPFWRWTSACFWISAMSVLIRSRVLVTSSDVVQAFVGISGQSPVPAAGHSEGTAWRPGSSGTACIVVSPTGESGESCFCVAALSSPQFLNAFLLAKTLLTSLRSILLASDSIGIAFSIERSTQEVVMRRKYRIARPTAWTLSSSSGSVRDVKYFGRSVSKKIMRPMGTARKAGSKVLITGSLGDALVMIDATSEKKMESCAIEASRSSLWSSNGANAQYTP